MKNIIQSTLQLNRTIKALDLKITAKIFSDSNLRKKNNNNSSREEKLYLTKLKLREIQSLNSNRLNSNAQTNKIKRAKSLIKINVRKSYSMILNLTMMIQMLIIMILSHVIKNKLIQPNNRITVNLLKKLQNLTL